MVSHCSSFGYGLCFVRLPFKGDHRNALFFVPFFSCTMFIKVSAPHHDFNHASSFGEIRLEIGQLGLKSQAQLVMVSGFHFGRFFLGEYLRVHWSQFGFDPSISKGRPWNGFLHMAPLAWQAAKPLVGGLDW